MVFSFSPRKDWHLLLVEHQGHSTLDHLNAIGVWCDLKLSLSPHKVWSFSSSLFEHFGASTQSLGIYQPFPLHGGLRITIYPFAHWSAGSFARELGLPMLLDRKILIGEKWPQWPRWPFWNSPLTLAPLFSTPLFVEGLVWMSVITIAENQSDLFTARWILF